MDGVLAGVVSRGGSETCTQVLILLIDFILDSCFHRKMYLISTLR